MKCLILAAAMPALVSLTENFPKPLLKVGENPFSTGLWMIC